VRDEREEKGVENKSASRQSKGGGYLKKDKVRCAGGKLVTKLAQWGLVGNKKRTEINKGRCAKNEEAAGEKSLKEEECKV